MLKKILSHYLGISFDCVECLHLRMLVEQERRDKAKLLDAILLFSQPKVPEPEALSQEPVEIRKPVMRTSQLRPIMEHKDRERIKRENDEKIDEIRRMKTEELEESLGIRS